MGARRSVAIGTALVLSFAAGWGLRADRRGDDASAEKPPGATIDDVRRERDALRAELARARRHRPASPPSRAEDEPESVSSTWDDQVPGVPPPARTPTDPGRFVAPAPVPGFENELTRGDWQMIGALILHRREYTRLRLEEAAGRELTEEEDERADWLEDWVLEGLEGLPEELVGVLGDSPDEVLAHPAVTVNLMLVVLDATGHPASDATRARLIEIARRWAEREEHRAANEKARPHASFLRHVMDQVELREAFLEEAFSILTPEQHRALRAPEEVGRLGSDTFSAAPLILPLASAVWGVSEEPEPIGVRLYHGNGPGAQREPDAVRLRLRQIAEEWGEALPEEAFPVPAYDGEEGFQAAPLYPTSFGRALLETQADLCDRWLRDGGLSASGRESLKEERDLFIISPTSWAAR